MSRICKELDLAGQQFGKLTAIKETSRERKGVIWLCRCSCGKTCRTTKSYLINGRTKSCGCSQRSARFPGNEPSLRYWYTKYRTEAKQRDLVFDLSRDEFKSLTSSECFYCLEEPARLFVRPRSLTSTTDCLPYACNGIDRIDSKIGYTVNNCVPCCTTCNRMKMALTQHDFLSHIRKIANNLKR